ncbi:MAG: hypothetical protein HQ541_23660 [Mariniphaga sp.]|nr:hypothetical protein [Mariniphaga sp.]
MKTNLLIYEIVTNDGHMFQKIEEKPFTRFEHVSEEKEIDGFKYHELENSTQGVDKVWIAKHNLEDLRKEIIKDNSIKKDFYEKIPDEIKKGSTLIIAGHWGDNETKQEYKNFIKKINDKQKEVQLGASDKCFISYFGSKLLTYTENYLENVIPEILEFYLFSPASIAGHITYFYTKSKESLEEYSKSLNDQEEKEKIREIEEFINMVNELEKCYINLAELLNPPKNE